MKPTQPPTAREEAEELSVKIVRQYAAGIHILEREMLRKIIVKALLYFADGRLEEAKVAIQSCQHYDPRLESDALNEAAYRVGLLKSTAGGEVDR